MGKAVNQIALDTRLGKVFLRWTGKGLITRVRLVPGDFSPKRTKKRKHKDVSFPIGLEPWMLAIRAYFDAGTPLPTLNWKILDTSGWTVFQKEVYEVANQIPHGETRSYAWIAKKMGKPQASRAVGQALRKNPIPILIPCHRVVSSHGGLGGFMGQRDPSDPKLVMKQALIKLEEQYLSPLFPFLNAPTFHDHSQFVFV